MRIDLIVRGVCCLRPQVAGLSRTSPCAASWIVSWSTAGSSISRTPASPKSGSAAPTGRRVHFLRRIEVLFPIEDGNLRERIRSLILEALLNDNVKARFLQPSGAYSRPRLSNGTAPRRSQSELLQAAVARPEFGTSQAKTKTKYPRFKLAPRPFAARRK